MNQHAAKKGARWREKNEEVWGKGETRRGSEGEKGENSQITKRLPCGKSTRSAVKRTIISKGKVAKIKKK